MTRDSLLKFMKRILEKGSPEKSRESLQQLKKILELQNAGIENIKLVESTLVSIPEAKEIAIKDSFSEEELKIAFRRAAERRRREEELATRGRC
ncbi:MAG: hypothetical protein IKW90_01975 [Lachnospiraceae bacterium]|nr:hypothetical protein [Lachnospiraceae bacterium]